MNLKVPEVGDISSLGGLFTLLPGLITYLIVHVLCERHKKLDAADVVLKSLAYTLLCHAIWQVLKSMGSLIPTPDIIGLPVCAIALGLFAARLANSGAAYRLLRRLRMTDQPSWVSIWDSAFREFRDGVGEYTVLILKDGRRIYGAIRGFSSEQREGHVCLDRFRWLDADIAEPEVRGTILVNAEDVAFVHFIPAEKVPINGREEIRPTSPAASSALGAD